MLCHLVAWIEQSIPDELLVNPDVRPDPTNQYLKIKVYDYDKDFFEGCSPERKTTPLNTYLDILNTKAQQLNPDEEIFETNDVYM